MGRHRRRKVVQLAAIEVATRGGSATGGAATTDLPVVLLARWRGTGGAGRAGISTTTGGACGGARNRWHTLGGPVIRHY